MRIQFKGPLREVGPVVQLRRERYHSPIRFVQFAIQLSKFVLTSLQLFQGAKKLFVLLLELFVRVVSRFFDYARIVKEAQSVVDTRNATKGMQSRNLVRC
jgi:hypothetical protein